MFVADDLAAWLVGLLADAGRKKLTTVILGSQQEGALRAAATAAVQLTANDLCPGDVEHVALVISQVFGDPAPTTPLAGQMTVLEGLIVGVAAQLAVLDDTSLTGTGQSSAEILGVPGAAIAQQLTAHLLQEIIIRGSRGGPLFPLASQLNNDVTHLQGYRIETVLGQLADDLRHTLARMDATHALATTSAMNLGSHEPGLIIDIGSVGAPNKAFDLGEVRFSVSNYGDEPLKITSIALKVAERRESMTTLSRVPMAPVDEYFLFAEVVEGRDLYELLDRHHVLGPLDTDGFFLKIDAPEGFELVLMLVVTWNLLGSPERRRIESSEFSIDYAAHSPAAMLQALKRRRMLGG